MLSRFGRAVAVAAVTPHHGNTRKCHATGVVESTVELPSSSIVATSWSAPDGLLMTGNFDGVKPEIGRMSAGYGLLLRGDGKGDFTAVRVPQSGFFVPGQARDIKRVRTRTGDIYVVARNNDRPLVFRATRSAAAAAH